VTSTTRDGHWRWTVGAAALLGLMVIAGLVFLTGQGSPSGPDRTPDSDPGARKGVETPAPLPGLSSGNDENRPGDTRVIVRCPGVRIATAFASRSGDEGEMSTERTELREGEACMLIPAEWFGDATSVELMVGVAGGGVSKTTKTLAVNRGQDNVVTLSPDTGLELNGRIVDQYGSGVPDLPLIARSTRRPGPRQPWMYDTDDALFSALQFDEARCVTLKDGSFSLSGLEARSYYIEVSDLIWELVPRLPPPRTPPQIGIELKVLRTCRLELTVTDAETGDPVPHSRGRFRVRTIRSRESMTCNCRDGKGAIVWVSADERQDQGTRVLDIQVTAFGYEPRTVQVEFPDGERSTACSVKLAPLPMGEMVFEISLEDGSPLLSDVTARISGSGGGHVIALKKDAGSNIYRQSVPAGSWKVEVYPAKAFGITPLSWSDRLQVPENGEVFARVQFAAFGSLAVDRGPYPGLLLELRVAGRRIITGISENRPRIKAIRAGVWPYVASATVDGKTQQVQKGTIEVRGGEETLLKIE